MNAATYPKPSFCATCLEDSANLRPTWATTWGGMTCVRWLCWDCFAGGDFSTLRTFDPIDREASGMVARGKGRAS